MRYYTTSSLPRYGSSLSVNSLRYALSVSSLITAIHRMCTASAHPRPCCKATLLSCASSWAAPWTTSWSWRALLLNIFWCYCHLLYRRFLSIRSQMIQISRQHVRCWVNLGRLCSCLSRQAWLHRQQT